MQSYLYKRLFFYSISKSISSRVLHDANKSYVKKVRTTLHHRFIKYFEEALKANAKKNLETDAGCFINGKNLRDTNRQFAQCDEGIKKLYKNLEMTQNSPASNVSLIINQIQDLENLSHPREIKLQLKMIDRQSCSILNTLSFDQTLSLLNKLMEIVPNKLVGLNMYQRSIKKLCSILFDESIKSEKIVNLLFVASLTKTRSTADVSVIFEHLPEMSDLSLIEKCIVSIATFKAGVKLDRKSIQTIEDTLNDSLELLIAEPGLFVSLLKAVRYGQPSTEFSLTSINKRLLENKLRYSISIAVPILALYAEMLKLEKNVVKRLVADSISDIAEPSTLLEYKSESLSPVRIKDVDRLLWATSRLNYRPTDQELADIEKFIETRLSLLSIDPKVFCRMLLSLWMLRSSKCQENVEHCFREKIFEPLLTASEEDQTRLKLLLECVRIEAPRIEIPSVFSKEVKEKSMRTCRELRTVSELIKCLAEHLALSDTKIDCPVKGIRIFGITTRHQLLGWIHIDIMNNVTCLKDTKKPNGLMSLKLRLVKKLGYESILLYNDGAIKIESMITRIEESINFKLKKKNRGINFDLITTMNLKNNT